MVCYRQSNVQEEDEGEAEGHGMRRIKETSEIRVPQQASKLIYMQYAVLLEMFTTTSSSEGSHAKNPPSLWLKKCDDFAILADPIMFNVTTCDNIKV